MTKGMKGVLCGVCWLAALLTPHPSALAQATPAAESVTLALKWYHQFQFAGYYAAVEKGFYAAEGLTVTLREPVDRRLPLDLVPAGEAEYGVAAADLLRARAGGAPVVALAVIFQHSPVALLSRADRGLRGPGDLVGKTVMIEENTAVEFKALLRREGIALDSIRFVPHTWRVDELLDGRVDATVDYITDEPNRLRERGAEPALLRPLDYGIDFYGDTLFTSERELRAHPDRVAAFRRASLRGWEYAMANPEELIAHILRMPGVAARGVTAEHLRYEAAQMAPLIQAQLVELGHMNRGRWQRMADTYVELGLLQPGFALNGFLYDPAPRPGARRILYGLGGLGIGVLVVGGLALLWNRQLRRSVREQTAELQASRAYLKNVLDASHDAVFVHDAATGQVLDVNRRVCELYGCTREQALAAPMVEFSQGEPPYSANDATAWLRRARHEGPQVFTWHARRRDGSLFWVEVAVRFCVIGGAERFVVLARDISDRRRVEEETRRLNGLLDQARKMESVGRLAGGVAHDFNNMLGVILGRAEVALDKLPADSPARDDLAEVSKAARRSADLTRQLLAYARKQPVAPRVLDLHGTVEGLLTMLRRLIGEHIALVWEPAPGPLALCIDPSQLDQILTNLCVNARDAIDGAGRVTLATAVCTLDAAACAGRPGIVPGPFVRLSVQDSGRGMDAQVLAHLFEPFFTTKEIGRGTGLGLAMVYGIVRQNDGFIDVRSAPGAGTTFDLYLPRHPGPVPAPPPERSPPRPAEGRPVVLVVEDEPAILELCRDVLQRGGYLALCAGSPAEALRTADLQGASIELLLSDVVMPEMNGWELARRVCARHPHIRRLFMSGYPADVLARQGVEPGEFPFISKPFTSADLLRAVRSALKRD
jgi:two-component system cell cycle sensor histidine kinase/response regulator CckA